MRTSDILVYMPAVLAVCISCMRDPEIGSTDGEPLTLSVSVDSGNISKGTSSGDEEAVNGVQIVLFRDGILYASASSGKGTVDLKVSKGEYDLFAFVNDPSDWISRPELTEEMILNSASSYSDNSLSSFVMFGSHPSLEVDDKYTSVHVHVDRLMSKIVLEDIAVDFSSNTHYKGCGLLIRNIYLTNVIGNCPYSLIPSAAPSSTGLWFNRMGPEDCPAPIDAMTADKGLEITVPDGSSKNIGLIYYAYPNGCISDSDSGTWQARRCRLAIEAVLDGKECWYHITMPPMKANSSYIIRSCTIKNIGGRSPEDNSWPSCEAVITESLNWDHTFTVEEES